MKFLMIFCSLLTVAMAASGVSQMVPANLDEAMSIAALQHKLILADFFTEW